MTNQIVPLSNGNSAEMRRPAELTERQRRPVVKALGLISPAGQTALDASRRLTEDAEAAGDKKLSADQRKELSALVQFSEADLDQLNGANDLGIVAFTKHWSLGGQVTLDAVLDLPGPDYDTMRRAVAPLVAELFVSFGASKDPASPTEPSSDSATRSEEDGQIVSPMSGGPTSSSAPA